MLKTAPRGPRCRFFSLLPLAALLLLPSAAVEAKRRSKKAPAKRAPKKASKAAKGAVSGTKGRVATVTKSAPKSAPVASKRGSTAGNPFARLKVVTPRDKLAPLNTVRGHDRLKTRDRAQKKKIKVSISSRPSGASVTWGRRSLGTTPLTVVAPEGSTPMDLVLRRRGYMVLRTRVQRRISRRYFFKLHPAKFR